MAQRMDIQYIRLYTDGSAALKLEPAVSQNKPNLNRRPYKVKCKKIYVDPVAILSIAVAVCMLVMMCVGFAQLGQAKKQVAVMEAYVDRLQAENERLTMQYQEGYNLEEVRQTALEMNMIPAEQAQYVLIEIPAEPEQPTQVSLWERLGTFLTGLFA